jgi:predicted permease
MENLLQDIRFGIRMLWKNPVFTILAVLALAIGIGANTSIFSVVNTVLLKALPYKEPDRLVMVWSSSPKKGFSIIPVSPANYVDFREQNRVFDAMGISNGAIYSLTGEGEPETVLGYRFSSNFFEVMGVGPLFGRTFLPEEERAGANRVVILSYKFWQRRYGGDSNVLGKQINLSGNPHTVIGVMPAGFQHPQVVDLWTPLVLTPENMANRTAWSLRIVARLKSGISIDDAQAEMQAIARRLEEQYPDVNTGLGVRLISISDNYVGDIKPALLVLLGAVGFVLLIACSNVANLLLARATARRKEIAIRAALGAGRLRLLRQFLTESVLLSLIGGILGLIVTLWSVNLLVAIFPNNIENMSIPTVEQIPIDGRVLAFSFLLSLLTGLLFGLAPALHAIRPDLNISLRESKGTSMGSGGRRFSNLLVVSQTALALILLVGAGLMIRSFMRLSESKLGFDYDKVLAIDIRLPRYKYDSEEKQRSFVNAAIDKLGSIPGVESAGAINFLPLSGNLGAVRFSIEGRPYPKPGEETLADDRVITEGYFRSMGIGLLRGREFTWQDRQGSTQVAIINETMAHRFWPNEDPVGKRVNIGDQKEPNWYEIVGIVSDVNSFGPAEEIHSDFYRAYAQAPYPFFSFTIRASSDPMSLAAAVREAVWSVDKDQPLKIKSMSQLAYESNALRRISMIVLTVFAAIAMILSAIGIYAVMSYSVTQRTQEIGIRMALGADRRDILKMVIGQGMTLSVIGIAIGLASAFALTRLMSSLLYKVSANDPLTYFAISLLFITVAFLASYIPARRALKVDPMVALRYE